MSMWQLLAAGRSVRRIKDSPSQYQLVDAYLPKLGVNEPLHKKEPAYIVTPRPVVSSRPPGFLLAWQKVFHGTVKRQPALPRISAPVKAQPQQMPLALEQVEPMRNDLWETDFELARPRKATHTISAASGQVLLKEGKSLLKERETARVAAPNKRVGSFTALAMKFLSSVGL